MHSEEVRVTSVHRGNARKSSSCERGLGILERGPSWFYGLDPDEILYRHLGTVKTTSFGEGVDGVLVQHDTMELQMVRTGDQEILGFQNDALAVIFGDDLI